MQEDQLTPAEKELAAALGGLTPASPAIDRDRMMYQAGRASARRGARIWQGASALLGACLIVAVAVRPAPHGAPPVAGGPKGPPAAPTARATVPAIAAAHVPARPIDASYHRLRSDVLQYGLAALPPLSESSQAEEPLTLRQPLAPPEADAASRSSLARLWGLLQRRQSQ
jgi:hypothetical protein